MYPKHMDPIFEVRDAEDGGYYARALGHAIFTQSETWDELRANVLEAAALHFEDGPLQPRLIQLAYRCGADRQVCFHETALTCQLKIFDRHFNPRFHTHSDEP
jgi:predicted RNase H-like HicB family nuclease